MDTQGIVGTALKERIRDLALSLGFDACGFAPACPAPHAEAFRLWLEAGCAGDMHWLENNPDRRTDPKLVLEEARSVIVVARNYAPAAGAAPQDAARSAQIARYAWGEDYHEVLTPRLKSLDGFLESLGGRQRSYVDTGPVLERDYAALAGIGWHGKSTMLISRKLGAFFFLGVILTTLELEPDKPAKDRCGSCNRCIDVCPTAAITAPHHLDARRCIAYLTIELKGAIPEEFRPLIGNRIYGCDDCAAVCPWNRFATASGEARFTAREFVHDWTLRDFLSLDHAGFNRLFKGSPIKRIKRRGFLRNVCVALGNTGSHEDLPALAQAATDPEPLIAEHAQWAVEQIRRRPRRDA